MLLRGNSIVILAVFAAACHSSAGGGYTSAAGASAGASLAASGGGGSGGSESEGGRAGTGGSAQGGFASGGVLASGGQSFTGDVDAGRPPSSGGSGSHDAAADQGGGTKVIDAPLAFDLAETGRPDAPLTTDLGVEAVRKPDAGASPRLAVPLYIWPGEGDEWARVAAAGSAVSYIVANAGDPGGPGPSADSTYTTAITKAHQAGQRVLGYVDTSYASRALSAVSAEVNQWYSFYPEIDGIFLDQTPGEASSIASYLKPASDQIRGKPGAHIVIFNPGQPDIAEGTMAVADVVMSYENPYGSSGNGYASGQYSSPSWMGKYAADRFWHVILEVPDASAMRNVLDLARSRNAGHVYVTNYADPPAYARLPSYFEEEVAALGR
jgi:hypothetical protein